MEIIKITPNMVFVWEYERIGTNEVEATMKTFKEKFPKNEIVAVPKNMFKIFEIENDN
jgi:hypothetical protein